MASEDSNSERLNIRIPKNQYKLIRQFGATIGLENDSACVRHFLTMGLQATMSGFSSMVAVQQQKQWMDEIKEWAETSGAQQMDLVEEVKQSA